MIFLPDKIENFDKFINSPIPIFEKKNFLNNELYDQLAASFPKEDLMTKKEHVGLKVSLNNDCPTFQKVVSNNEPWKTFYDNFNSKKTVFLFLDLIKSELDKIENRKNLKNFFFTSDVNKGLCGAPARSRTADLLITNQLLYQLSYKGISFTNN